MSRVAALHGSPRPRHRPAIRVHPGADPSATSIFDARLRLIDDGQATRPGKEKPAMILRFWIAQFLYPGPDGKTRLAVRRIRAIDRDSAEAAALRAAPKDEFVLTLVPESDDQFLGQVRHRVLAAKAKRP